MGVATSSVQGHLVPGANLALNWREGEGVLFVVLGSWVNIFFVS